MLDLRDAFTAIILVGLIVMAVAMTGILLGLILGSRR